MKHRKLGPALAVSELGLGCMGMTWAYGATAEDRPEACATIRHALDCGINFIDTADVYGPYTNEELVGEAIKGRRDDVVLATKFGIIRDLEEKPLGQTVNGHPDYVKAACEGSLKRLGVDHIDLYYLHRLDPDVPVEDTVGAMAELVQAGKVRFLGLSEVSGATISKAHKVHLITAVQSEYSLWTRDIENNGVLETLRRLNIGLVAYAPLGRGFLTGKIRSLNDLAENDYRRSSPRFQGENLEKNLAIVKALETFAAKRGITPAQLALSYVLAQGQDIVPIVGTRHKNRIDENIAACNVNLTAQECEELSALLPDAQGQHYPAYASKEIDS